MLNAKHALAFVAHLLPLFLLLLEFCMDTCKMCQVLEF